ncbi:transcription/translation regulatory transformer protein RfaH [Pseudomonas cavernae]|uniref:Transcription antitermination protein RfaH n=1 Tax=Pseudomonas cavernae TaxID=2320867 RepID=A0A385YZP9_9PSED|nr:transcription/translation regulatory transformer protein RfaH [Pseudomonas cavernae]AYC31447.1 transcription/translation regulatory transformer protein RfaH [Pseudomonas cavernae]
MNSSKENTGKAWYLVQCKARQDERAEENLLRQGYVCYRPKLKRERLLRRHRQMVEESLFPGYLFVQLSQQDGWGPLRSTRGVTRIVSFGSQPVAVDDYLIEQLQQHEHEPYTQELLTAGEKVRINEGPFAELEGIFLAMDGNKRVVLLLNFLQREQKILMPVTGISKI